MRSWRYITIPREGIYYLLVIVFILGGAVLREVNLLVILAGMMIGPFVFNWRLVTMMMRQLTIRRRVPSRVTAGEPFTVELQASNHRRLLGTWSLAVEDFVKAAAEESAHPVKAEVLFPYIAPSGRESQTWRCLLTRRGLYRLGPLRLSTGFPLGLVRSRTTLAVTDEVLVHPRQGKLSRKWRALSESNRMGDRQAHRRQGVLEGDFYALREWRSGDSRRWIHWRTSARLGTLAVRQFEQQRNRDVAIVLDLWCPPDRDDKHAVYVELAVSLAATAIAAICRSGAGRINFAIAGAASGEEPPCWTTSASALLATEVLDYLATVSASAEPPFHPIASEVRRRTSQDSQMIVISTRRGDLESLRATETTADDAQLARLLAESQWIDVTGKELPEYFELER